MLGSDQEKETLDTSELFFFRDILAHPQGESGHLPYEGRREQDRGFFALKEAKLRWYSSRLGWLKHLPLEIFWARLTGKRPFRQNRNMLKGLHIQSGLGMH